MSPLAVFGITSDGVNLVVNLLLLFLAVFWIALVYWTFADARRRISDPMLVGCATAASLFPFAGTMVYMIVRPPEYLADVRERELEIAAAEVRLAAIENLTCSYCNFRIEGSFLRCPSCLRRLKEPCGTCHKPLDPTWKICPYCESEIGQPAAQPQPRRRARPRPVAAVAPEAQRPAVAPDGQRQAAAAPDRQRQAAAARAAERAASAQRAAAASTGEARRKPAASAGDAGRRAASSGDGSQRPRKQPPRSASPAADGQAKRDGRRNRSSQGSQRPAARDQPQRPPGGERQKRSGAPAAKRPAPQAASDAVTAEQPVARPRTRPPSAG